MPDPLRRVVSIITERYTRTITTAKGRKKEVSFPVDFEVLECGHRRKPKDNALFGGTDIGNAKKRRCIECRGDETITPTIHQRSGDRE
jgi:hypothetical protein